MAPLCPPLPQEVLLKRAADLAEALYGVPSSNQVRRRRPAPPRALCPPRARGCPAVPLVSPQELLLKRAADVAEALYSAPRAPAPLGPLAPSHPHPAVVGINAFSSPLAIAVGEATPGPEPGASRRPPRANAPCPAAPCP